MDIEQQYDKIYRYCFYRLRKKDIAEDITQEVFARYFASDVSRNGGENIRYIYTIAANLCTDIFRSDTWDELSEDCSEGDDEQTLDNIALREALDCLSEEDRELLILRYVNDEPMSVLCKMYGMSRFALYRKLQSLLKKLKSQLGEGWQ